MNVIKWIIAFFIIAYNRLYIGKNLKLEIIDEWDKLDPSLSWFEGGNEFTRPVLNRLPETTIINRFHLCSNSWIIVFFEIECYLFKVNGFRKFNKNYEKNSPIRSLGAVPKSDI